jgi:hypothetical protein
VLILVTIVALSIGLALASEFYPRWSALLMGTVYVFGSAAAVVLGFVD